jgi:hypothetical protein
MRHTLLVIGIGILALACGSSQPESPMSPRPNAQQAEPTAMPPEQAPDAENKPPAEPSTPPPNAPRSMTRDAAMPQMVPQQQPPSQPSAATPKVGCQADTDCAAIDDMCGMCRCLALAKDAEAPACQGTKVQCIMAPCRGKRPVCAGGTCSLIDASSGAM